MIGRRARRSPALAALVALCLAATLALVGCDEEPSTRPQRPKTGQPPEKTTLTFGVWGPDSEIRAYQAMVDEYNTEAEAVEVEITSWPDHRAMMAAFAQGEPAPDLFMVTRGALSSIRAAELNHPLLELLDERGVEYGDDYYRDAIQAFSGDDELQCMPYGVSPMVIYYNTELVDFDRMRQRRLPAPDEGEEHQGWSFDEFRAAAEFASRPRKRTAGLYVEPTLHGLAPFVYAGGGTVYDDGSEPTSLAFSSGGTRDALTQALEVLRNPQLTLSDRQLSRRSALEWFKRGRLGMLPGYRDLTPELRAVPGLDFDVLPMPRIERRATVGDFTGLCISAQSASISQTADFLVHVVSDEALARVVSAGYLAPANLDVATSPTFLQPEQRPAHAGVFNATVGDMVLQPLIDDYPGLERAIQRGLRQLFRAPVLDLETVTSEIDEASRAVLDPDYEPEPPSGSASPSTGSTGPDPDSEDSEDSGSE